MTQFVDPTPTTFKARFPSFAIVADDVVAQAITEGKRSVDQRWTPGDYTLAIMLAAAHVLTLDGFGAEGGGGFAEGVTKITSGPLSVERTADAANAPYWKRSSYGVRFLELLRRNVPAVAVTR